MLMFAELVELAADRELPGFEAVYKTYAGRMLGVALGILHSRALAEDAVHEAFIKIIKNYQKFLQIDCQKQAAWIVIIIRNTALDMLRHEKRQLPVEFEAASYDSGSEGELLAAVTELPAIYRDVLSLRYVYGYSLQEAAGLLGVSYATVAQRAARARAMLKRALELEQEPKAQAAGAAGSADIGSDNNETVAGEAGELDNEQN